MRERHGTPSPPAIHRSARSWLICRRPLIPRLGAGDYMRPTDEGEPARGGRAIDEKVFPHSLRSSRRCVLSLLKRRHHPLIPILSSRFSSRLGVSFYPVSFPACFLVLRSVLVSSFIPFLRLVPRFCSIVLSSVLFYGMTWHDMAWRCIVSDEQGGTVPIQRLREPLYRTVVR